MRRALGKDGRSEQSIITYMLKCCMKHIYVLTYKVR